MKSCIYKLEALGLMFFMGWIVSQAQTFTEWKDPEVNQVNRLEMHTDYVSYPDRQSALAGDKLAGGN